MLLPMMLSELGNKYGWDSLTGGDPPELRESKKKEALRYFDQSNRERL